MRHPATLRRARNADPTARLLRVRSLPHAPVAQPDLLAAVDDPSLQVARAALTLLISSGGPETGAQLAERLLAVDIGLVPDCARAVARLDRAAGARVAIDGLRSPHAPTRHAAAIALAELDWPAARTELERVLADEAGFVRRSAVAALAHLEASPRTVALLVERLDDPDVGVRVSLVDAVARRTPEPSAELWRTLDDPDARVRRALARNAAHLSGPLLERLLSDPDEDVRVETLWKLLETPRDELASAIRRRLRDISPRVRRAACRALGPVGDPFADEVLVELLGDPDSHVRAAALRSLRERRPRDAPRYLARRLGRVDARLRPTLLYAVARLDGAVADAWARRLDLVHDRSPEVRIAIAHCCLPGSRDLLAVLALDSDADVRHAARTRRDRDA